MKQHKPVETRRRKAGGTATDAGGRPRTDAGGRPVTLEAGKRRRTKTEEASS